MTDRNLNLHAEARVAMVVWSHEYAYEQKGGSMDFWDSRTDGQKATCVGLVDEIRRLPRADGTPPPTDLSVGIKAAQITMGRGLVDVTTITHEGRSGILFRPRDQHIPVGDPGELQGGEYWPVEGDVVIWIENEGGAAVIDKHLQAFMAPPTDLSVGSSDLIESGKMARTRLMNYANAVQRGEVQGGGREFERRVWGAFSDFDQACDAAAANSPAPAEQTLERVARAIARDNIAFDMGFNGEAEYERHIDFIWKCYEGKARAAIAAMPPPVSMAADNQPRYTTKRMHDEIDKAKAYARSEALEEAAAERERLESIHRTEIADMAERFRSVNVSEAVKQLADILPAPVGLSIAELQRAHVERQEEWCPDQKPDLSFRGNELGGECGEAQNVIKKLERERHGWRGSRDTVEHLAEELGDVIHCAVLCAITAGIELEPAVIAKFNSTSEKNGLATMLRAALSSPMGEVE